MIEGKNSVLAPYDTPPSKFLVYFLAQSVVTIYWERKQMHENGKFLSMDILKEALSLGQIRNRIYIL
jgi:hypothetical protein